MAITYIKRITGATNSLVQLDTSDTTATALGADYILLQTPNITALNDGVWTWEPTDMILLSASDGISWCAILCTSIACIGIGWISRRCSVFSDYKLHLFCG